jgi:hypothetical protein
VRNRPCQAKRRPRLFDARPPIWFPCHEAHEFPEERLSDAFDELFEVNVKGCFFGAKAALPELIKTRGSMVFTASVAGLKSSGDIIFASAKILELRPSSRREQVSFGRAEAGDQRNTKAIGLIPMI